MKIKFGFLSYLSLTNYFHYVTMSFDCAVEECYLLYYSHSGFGNQLKGMYKAAFLAALTNRTLVLPPVLPHIIEYDFKKPQEQLLFPEFRGRGAGKGCDPYDKYEIYIQYLKDDIKKASNPEIRFPSFTELFSFDDISKTRLKAVDMREFANYSENINTSLWCTGGGINTMRNILVQKKICEKSYELNWTTIIQMFQNFCGNNQRVASIGSCYTLPTPERKNVLFQEVTNFYDRKIIPSNKIIVLLKEIYSRIPDNYYGVHIRFEDKMVIDDCNSSSVKGVYDRVLDILHMFSNKQRNSTSIGYILIGNSNKATLKCLRYHSQGKYNSTTINEIIDNNDNIKSMIDKVDSEKSTVYLLLDQILISLADKIVLIKGERVTTGTFHNMIKHWHLQKDRVLEKMQNMSLTDV